VRISKIEIIGSTRMKRKSSVVKKPSVPMNVIQSHCVPQYMPHDDGTKSRCRLVTTITKRSSHMPTETMIEIANSMAIEFRARAQSGGWKWLHARGRVTERTPDGRALRMSGMVADVDTRKHVEAAVGEADQRFRDVAAVSSEYVWEADADWRFTYLSERAEAILGYARNELLGRALWELLPLGEERLLRERFANHGGEGHPFRDLVHRVMTKSGGVIWQSLSGVPLFGANERWTGYRGTAADVTSRKQAEARIEQLTTRDALTGLANRALLTDRTTSAIGQAARMRSQLALLVIDLDRFKLVNDRGGHAAGDALLCHVAKLIALSCTSKDVPARLGGDEFAVLIRDCAAEEAEREPELSLPV